MITLQHVALVDERELGKNITLSCQFKETLGELRYWAWSFGKVGVVWAWLEHNSPLHNSPFSHTRLSGLASYRESNVIA